MTRRDSIGSRFKGLLQGVPVAVLGFAIGWGLLRMEPSTPMECVAVTVAGERTVWAGRSGWRQTFVVVADTGTSAQFWSEPVRAPFDSTYRGPALLSVRHGAWFGDHTVLGRRCVASRAPTAPLRRDPHRLAGYVPTDLAGATGGRLFVLTVFIELAVLFEAWRLWSRYRRARGLGAHGGGLHHTSPSQAYRRERQLPGTGERT